MLIVALPKPGTVPVIDKIYLKMLFDWKTGIQLGRKRFFGVLEEDLKDLVGKNRRETEGLAISPGDGDPGTREEET